MHPPEQQTFADRLAQLFADRLHPSGRRYSDAEVATAVGLSRTAIWALRTGQATNPTHGTICALADFFGVAPAYFFGDPAADAQLQAALADAGVREIAARAVGLSDDSKRVVLDVLDRIRRLEQPEA